MASLLPSTLAPLVALLALAPAAEGEEVEETTNREVLAMNRGISVMLLGSVTFMMGLFYLVNQSDNLRRRDSWMVISATISIFSAVLLFQGVYGVIEAMLLEGASEERKCAVNMVQMLFWLVFLQVFTAWISGSLSSDEGKEANGAEKAKLDLDCFATLLGHITAFAAINAFANLQQIVPGGIGYKAMVVPLAWFFVFLCGKFFDSCRERFALVGDDEKDEFEVLWDEAAEETEDDIIGLAVSFLVTQVLRMFITGYMPDPEGEDPEERVSGYSIWDVVCLAGWALVVLALEGVRLVVMHRLKHPRLTPQLQNVVAMNVAWCLFFGTDWCFTMKTSFQGMMKKVAIALSLTFLAMSMIFLTDSLREFMHASFSRVSKTRASTTAWRDSEADLQRQLKHEQRQLEHKADLQKFLQGLVKSLAILIGFSWEKAFDASVEGVAQATETPPPYLTKMALGFLLACVVVPAWRAHILPTINQLKEEEEKEDKEECKEIDPEAFEEEAIAEEQDKIQLSKASCLAEKREIRRQASRRKSVLHERLEVERVHLSRRTAQVRGTINPLDPRRSKSFDAAALPELQGPLLAKDEKSKPDTDARAADRPRRSSAQEAAGQELREPADGEGESGRAAARAETPRRSLAHESASRESAAARAAAGLRAESDGDWAQYGGPAAQRGAQGLSAHEGASSSLRGSSAIAKSAQSASSHRAAEIRRNAARYEERAANLGKRKADIDKQLDAVFSKLSDLDQRSRR